MSVWSEHFEKSLYLRHEHFHSGLLYTCCKKCKILLHGITVHVCNMVVAHVVAE